VFILLPFIIVGGLAGLGYLAYKKLKEDAEEYKKLKEKEEKIWNHGHCDKCGRKWKAYYYFPQGSRGAYEYLSITCHKCRRKADLTCYKPPKDEFDNGYTILN